MMFQLFSYVDVWMRTLFGLLLFLQICSLWHFTFFSFSYWWRYDICVLIPLDISHSSRHFSSLLIFFLDLPELPKVVFHLTESHNWISTVMSPTLRHPGDIFSPWCLSPTWSSKTSLPPAAFLSAVASSLDIAFKTAFIVPCWLWKIPAW